MYMVDEMNIWFVHKWSPKNIYGTIKKIDRDVKLRKICRRIQKICLRIHQRSVLPNPIFSRNQILV